MVEKILQGLWFVASLTAVGIAIRQGVLTETYSIDSTGISWVIMGLFVIATSLSIFKYAGSRWINVEHIRHLANDQAYLGLFGTIVGIFLSMKGVSGLETDLVLTAVPKMLMAFWTSIVGMSGAWLTMKSYEFLGGRSQE